MKKKISLLTITAIVCVWTFPTLADSPPPFQQPPIKLQASKVLPKDLLKGDNFTVDQAVQNDGFVNIYQLSTNYGDLKVESTAELMVLIAELRALTALEKMSQSEAFADGVRDGIIAPVQGIAHMVTAPVKTTKAVVSGTGTFLSNVGRSITSSDPDQANVVSAALGYDGTKRAYAYELGIDPYTSYEPVADRLGQIARASVAGGLAVAVGMEVAAGGTTFGMVLTISSVAEGMRQMARDNPPGELQKINRKKLEELGLDKKLVKAFLENYTYNPQEKTMLVGDLETMKGVKGLDVFISLATLVTDASTALYWRLTAQLMAGYHANVAPAAKIMNIAGWPVLQRKDGGVVALAAVDYVFWTEELAGLLKDTEAALQQVQGVKGKEYWITGKIDPEARKVLSAHGWKVMENANKKLVK